MPTNKNALTRLFLLDKALGNRFHAFSISDLTALVNDHLAEYGLKPVGKRCIEKDIDYLENSGPFNAELERYTVRATSKKSGAAFTKHCIRYADKAYSIFSKQLSDKQLLLLKECVSTLQSFDGLPHFEWITPLAELCNSGGKAASIHVSKNLTANSRLLSQAFNLIEEKAVATLRYQKYQADKPSEYIVSPYLIKEYNGRWYLIGYNHSAAKIYTFAFDRIKSLQVDTGHLYQPSSDELSERFDDIVGVSYYDEEPVQKIIFWVSPKAADYVATLPIHESQTPIRGERAADLFNKFQHLSRDGQFFSIECKKNPELIKALCSRGENIVVVTPKPIVDEIVNRINSMATAYSKCYSNINNEKPQCE
ncbi:MAG: WYL domain-containing protein [Muribaculaceae bacterium]|nr:WYL domain-containing protein [Muribaculaceae bacterium]